MVNEIIQSQSPQGVPNVPIGVFLEDDNNRKLAGSPGEIFGDWLCIRFIFVSEQCSGNVIGSKLIKAAEREAVRRGCKYAFADTFSFQFPAFYKRMDTGRFLTSKNIRTREKALLHERIM